MADEDAARPSTDAQTYVDAGNASAHAFARLHATRPRTHAQALANAERPRSDAHAKGFWAVADRDLEPGSALANLYPGAADPHAAPDPYAAPADSDASPAYLYARADADAHLSSLLHSNPQRKGERTRIMGLMCAGR